MHTIRQHIRPVEAAFRERFKVYTQRNFHEIPQLASLPKAQRFGIEVVASVLPFRVNRYVLDELIDWEDVPNDPIFQLTFPQREMLSSDAYDRMADLLGRRAGTAERETLAREIRATLNAHPAGQLEHNVPRADEEPLVGLQHKYRETVLFFPARGQVCHSYCTFCFRWAQFVDHGSMRFASANAEQLAQYLEHKPDVTDLLVTGGDPMVMRAHHLGSYLEPLLTPRLRHVQTIRIGTKSLTFWPQRYVSDPDADELLRLLERCVRAGKHVAIMAHYNHWRELSTPIAREAIRRVRATGAVIRAQGPLLRHINDEPAVWSRLWTEQIKLGIVPYYMFVERDTGPKTYFEVPLARGWQIYRRAIQRVSGLGRTVRGPSMSATPGKVEIQGITEINGERVFALRFIQGRNPDWVQRPFFARYDEGATWLDELEPAFGERRFFFEDA
jgi:KamA family protein